MSGSYPGVSGNGFSARLAPGEASQKAERDSPRPSICDVKRHGPETIYAVVLLEISSNAFSVRQPFASRRNLAAV